MNNNGALDLLELICSKIELHHNNDYLFGNNKSGFLYEVDAQNVVNILVMGYFIASMLTKYMYITCACISMNDCILVMRYFITSMQEYQICNKVPLLQV